MKRTLILIMGVVCTGLSLAGCRNELETGYEPRLLNASPTQQRGYYAMPYTPNQMQAQMDDRNSMEAHRPASGLR